MILEFMQKALFEDIGRGDLFENCVKKKSAKAVVKSKDSGGFCWG